MAQDLDLDPTTLRDLYKWIDTIPLSRPKKNISRDFSDGVLMSEVINHFTPHLVELHNYSTSNSVDKKEYNWNTLNQKCFRRLGFSITDTDIKMIVANQRGVIERILILARDKLALYQERQSRGGNSPGRRLSPGRRSPRGRSPGRGGKRGASPPRSKSRASPPRGNSPGRGRPADGKASISGGRMQAQMEQKDIIIQDLRETVDILQNKVKKLEQLMFLKNEKIKSLTSKLDQMSFQS